MPAAQIYPAKVDPSYPPGCGCATETLIPLPYTRPHSAAFGNPILDQMQNNSPILDLL